MVSLREGPKPNISVISGFLDPWDPLFMDFNIQKYFIFKYMGTFSKHANLDFQHFVSFGKDRHRKMMKIRLIKFPKYRCGSNIYQKNMNGIWLIWYRYPLQNIKWQFRKFVFLIILVDQKGSHRVFMKSGILRRWNLDEFWKTENGPKMISFSQGIPKKRNFAMVESWRFRKSENIKIKVLRIPNSWNINTSY